MIEKRELAPGRQRQIQGLTRSRGVVRVEELSRELEVSAATIRRDLGVLEREGRIRRVHGGAVSVESRLDEPLFDDKTSIAAKEKQRIAREALGLITEGDTIYLDGGSTVLELARLVRTRSDVTVVTNSLRAAIELSGQGPRTILIGGELRRRSQTIVGSLTRKVLDELHFDIAFMGTIGLTAADGLTTTDPNEAFTKERVMAHAERVVLLMHSAKAGKVSFARAGTLADLDTLITDVRLDPALAAELNETGIELIRV